MRARESKREAPISLQAASVLLARAASGELAASSPIELPGAPLAAETVAGYTPLVMVSSGRRRRGARSARSRPHSASPSAPTACFYLLDLRSGDGLVKGLFPESERLEVEAPMSLRRIQAGEGQQALSELRGHTSGRT